MADTSTSDPSGLSHTFVSFETNQFNPGSFGKGVNRCISSNNFSNTGFSPIIGNWYDIKLVINLEDGSTQFWAKTPSQSAFTNYGTYSKDQCSTGKFNRLYLGTGLSTSSGAVTEFDNVSIEFSTNESQVLYRKSANQTQSYQHFTFPFNPIVKSDGSNGTLIIRARGDFSTGQPEEYINWNIDGLTSGTHIGPTYGATVLNTYGNPSYGADPNNPLTNWSEWEQSIVIPGDVLLALTSDLSATVTIDFVGAGYNSTIGGFAEVTLQYNELEEPIKPPHSRCWSGSGCGRGDPCNVGCLGEQRSQTAYTLALSWTQLTGEPVSLNTGAYSYHPTFVAPFVPVGGTTLTFQLTVSDGKASPSPTDTVDVTVKNVKSSAHCRSGGSTTSK